MLVGHGEWAWSNGRSVRCGQRRTESALVDEVEALLTFEPVRAVSPKSKLASMWAAVKY